MARTSAGELNLADRLLTTRFRRQIHQAYQRGASAPSTPDRPAPILRLTPSTVALAASSAARPAGRETAGSAGSHDTLIDAPHKRPQRDDERRVPSRHRSGRSTERM